MLTIWETSSLLQEVRPIFPFLSRPPKGTRPIPSTVSKN